MNTACSRLSRPLALVLLLSAVASAQAPPPLRLVGKPVLNMYSSPSGDADVVSQAIYATAVTAVEETGGWTKIRTPDDYVGWVESAALVPQPGQAYGANTPVVHVRSLFAHVYREESVTKHAPLLTIPFDTRLEVEGPGIAADRWTLVRLPDGRRGAIQNGDIASGSPRLTIEETITLAKRFLGLPYTWGGHVELRFRLLRFHADADAPARVPAAA